MVAGGYVAHGRADGFDDPRALVAEDHRKWDRVSWLRILRRSDRTPVATIRTSTSSGPWGLQADRSHPKRTAFLLDDGGLHVQREVTAWLLTASRVAGRRARRRCRSRSAPVVLH